MLCHLVVFTKVREYLCQYLESNGRSICWDYNSTSLDISFSHTYVYPPSPPPFLVQQASLVCLFLQSLISASWIGSLVNVRNNKHLQRHIQLIQVNASNIFFDDHAQVKLHCGHHCSCSSWSSCSIMVIMLKLNFTAVIIATVSPKNPQQVVTAPFWGNSSN